MASYVGRLLLLWHAAALTSIIAGESGERAGDDDIALLVTPAGALHRAEHQRKRHSFNEFVAKHRLGYQEGGDEYHARKALFESRVREVERHNAQPGVSWRAGINRLAAWTEAELSQLRGYVRGGERAEGTVSMPGGGHLAMLQEDEQAPSKPSRIEDLPEAIDWKGKLNATSNVIDQGGCGSCWAVSAVTVLRAHSELFQRYRHFSIQQVLSCAPNPHKCGGEGGCGGATAEIAMDYAAKVGLIAEEEWPYSGEDEKCRKGTQMADKDALDADGASRDLLLVGNEGDDVAAAQRRSSSGLIGFHKLAKNRVSDLMLSLHNLGPITVSVYAGDEWNHYYSGVYNGCKAGEPINHAVVLVGYGKDTKGGPYWHLQNSWGETWGEDGFMRLGRKEPTEEEALCGWDKEPLVGSGCPGGPSKVWTCGSCGILYDAVVPRFADSGQGWWGRNGGAQA